MLATISNCNNVAFVEKYPTFAPHSNSLSIKSKYTTAADKLGILSAIICTAHCLLIPAFFMLRYSWHGAENPHHNGDSGLPSWWEMLDYIFLVIGLYAVYHASTHTSFRPVKAALWFFWGILAVAVVFEDSLHFLVYVASLGLVATHFFNIKRHRILAR